MTIRDIDCAAFDVEHMIEAFGQWRVSGFSFFAGGYVTTYPTRLAWQRVAPGLGSRDLCGEIIDAAHEAGMFAFPMVDLGEVPLEVADAHPDWVARQADGSFFLKSDGIVTSCPLGDYVRECSKELLGELLDRYEVDGIKFGGASYGFAPGVCHCPNCRRRYREETGESLPDDARDPAYAGWRERMMEQTVRYLVEVVHGIADVPVVGNSVWHLGRGMAIDALAREQDFVQVEVQTRTYPQPDEAEPVWERFAFPTETARYVAPLAQRPPWIVASYFLAWPWRRVAVPAAEQKIYLAQIAANGGSPMVNLSGGPPKVHEDARGFPAIESLYRFMAEHADLFDDEESAANVALVYDHASARRAHGLEHAYRHYLADLHGCEDALNRHQVPFDIVSAAGLAQLDAERYAVLVVPAATALSREAVDELVRLAGDGVGLVVDAAPGSAAAGEGATSMLRPLKDLLGVTSIEAAQPSLASPHHGPAQAYARPDARHRDHPLFEGIDADLIAMAGPWHPVRPADEVEVALRRAASFRLFPEGLSYPDHPDPDNPLAVLRDPADGGRTVYLPFMVGRAATRTGHPDLERLLVNAARWASGDRLPVALDTHSDVLLSIRRRRPGASDRTMVHLINTTGRRRYLTAPTPVHGLTLRVRGGLCSTAWLAGRGESVPTRQAGKWTAIDLPPLVDYDIVVLDR
jgi:hypothetical protein